MDLENAVWTKTWDFKARALTPSSGISSVASVEWQPGLDALVFFGWLGAVQPTGGVLGPFVGFAQIETRSFSPSVNAGAIELQARTDSPDLAFEIFVVDEALARANRKDGKERDFVAAFNPTRDLSLFTFEPKHFRTICRGAEIAYPEQVDLYRLQTMGFQIRKSSQVGSVKTTPLSQPFRLEITSIKL